MAAPAGARTFAKPRGDLALSTPRTSSCWRPRSLGILRLRIDYELARTRTGSAAVQRDAWSPTRSPRTGSTGSARVRQRCAGIRAQYYLHGFDPRPLGPDVARARPERIVVVVRTPPDVLLYHRHGNPLFEDVPERLGRDGRCMRSCSHAPRSSATRFVHATFRRSSSPSSAIDAQSLVALSDLVVSAGGTMNRRQSRSVVPVYTTFAGRPGGRQRPGDRRRLRALTPWTLSSSKRSGSTAESSAIRPCCSIRCSRPSSARHEFLGG